MAGSTCILESARLVPVREVVKELCSVIRVLPFDLVFVLLVLRLPVIIKFERHLDIDAKLCLDLI